MKDEFIGAKTFLSIVLVLSYLLLKLGFLAGTLKISVYKSTSAVVKSTFDGKVSEINNRSIIEFTLKAFQRPIDDSIVFLRNEKTKNVLRFLHGKCQNTYGENKGCQCISSQNNITFRWWYVVEVPLHSCTFGTEMSCIYENNGKIINIHLYRRFNGTVLGPLLSHVNEVDIGTKKKKGNDGVFNFILICSLTTVICLTITICLVGIYIKRRLPTSAQENAHGHSNKDEMEKLTAVKRSAI